MSHVARCTSLAQSSLLTPKNVVGVGCVCEVREERRGERRGEERRGEERRGEERRGEES